MNEHTQPSAQEVIDRGGDEFHRLINEYANDRLSFVRQVLNATPEPGQARALAALDAGEEKISIRSGHGVGKTTLLAWVMIHFILHRYPCKVVITAPSSAQLFDAAFSEIKIWIAKLPEVYKSQLEITSDRVYLKSAPAEAFITARTARAETPEALQGIHADYVLLVVDEASGVPEPIFESAQGSMSTHGAITMLTGNPTRRSGFFYSTHTKWADDWWTLQIPCSDSSQVQQSFIDGMAKRYGVDSAVYAVRVMGNFPPAEDDTFLPYYLINEAMERDIDVVSNEPYTFGVDVARFGSDKSVLCKRQGHYVHPFKAWSKLDTMQVSARVVLEYEALPFHVRPAEIYVDVIGIGAGVADRLRQMLARYPVLVVDVNVAESPALGSTYHRLRDELWGNIREAAETRKMVLPKDDELLGELTTPKMEFGGDGKMKLESKESMKRRGMVSPDKADALALSYAFQSSVASGLINPSATVDPNEDADMSWVL